MKTPGDQSRDDLCALWAVCLALRQLNGSRAKGEYLVQELTARPNLLRYFRCVYDPARQYRTTSALELGFGPPKSGTNADPPLTHILKGLADGTGQPRAFCLYHMALPKELRPVARGLLDKDLRVGVDASLFNKVLVKLGHTPYDLPQPPPAPAGVQPAPGQRVRYDYRGKACTGTIQSVRAILTIAEDGGQLRVMGLDEVELV